ncbi:MAG: hypothetical protein HZC36_04500 [Armatimonadetes bacterium]|nr:hypothetical protein [Armatimonadota bacterium]
MELGNSQPHRSAFARRQRGFTFIEMGAIIVIVVLGAMTAVASIAAAQRGEELRAFKADVKRLALLGREQAVSSGTTVTLAISSSESGLELRQSQVGAEGEESVSRLNQIQLPEGVSQRNFQIQGETVDSNLWAVRFFADGTCDQAAIEFWDGEDQPFSATFDPKTGRAKVTDGQIQIEQEDKWQAGELEIRGQNGGTP